MAIDADYAKHHAASSRILTTALATYTAAGDGVIGIRGQSAAVRALIQCGQHRYLRQVINLQIATYLRARSTLYQEEMEALTRSVMTSTKGDYSRQYNRAKVIKTQSLMIVEALEWLNTNLAQS